MMINILKLNGTSKSIYLENGSTVYINGIVNGDVHHKGGVLEIYGTINGEVFIDSNAKIN